MTAACALALLLAAWNGGAGGAPARGPEYAAALFDGGCVHQIDIEIENWEKFIKNATREEYSPCAVTIDGERFGGAGIRAKGNNSLRLTHKYGHTRYSLKIEFDRYIEGALWRGLDKLSLDAAFQDNSYLKNFIAYGLMARLGVPAPLRSFAWVTVNGEPHGLFLAVEEPEEAFALRNFGPAHGRLYKPDYRSLDDENADVALIYSGDDPRAYPGIFRRAKFPVSAADKRRLIAALERLSDESRCASAVDLDLAARYFAVQAFVVNADGYLGPTGHNYYLYEKDGMLAMLPWDYNLAFGPYSLGAPRPETDARAFHNCPTAEPAPREIPATPTSFSHPFSRGDGRALYRKYLGEVAALFESGEFTDEITRAARMIAPYVERDPTAFCSYADHKLAVRTIPASANPAPKASEPSCTPKSPHRAPDRPPPRQPR